jgi:hypothetical protein
MLHMEFVGIFMIHLHTKISTNYWSVSSIHWKRLRNTTKYLVNGSLLGWDMVWISYQVRRTATTQFNKVSNT